MLIFASFASQPIDLFLVPADLAILLVIAVLLALQLIADQSASTQAESAADQRARRRMADGAADDASSSCSSESAYTGGFFSRAQRSAGAAHADERRKHQSCQTFS